MITLKRLGIAAALIAATLLGATLGGTSTAARQTGAAPPQQPARTFIPVPDGLKPDGFEAQEKGGKIVGMALVKKDGSRMDLTQKPKPARDTVCPAGTKMVCWYGETEYYCFCTNPPGSGGGGGGGTLATLHSTSRY